MAAPKLPNPETNHPTTLSVSGLIQGDKFIYYAEMKFRYVFSNTYYFERPCLQAHIAHVFIFQLNNQPKFVGGYR